ncbi:MAG: ABC transporter ATP-binding protein [Alphaproteobacteria bacterium]
MATDTVGDNVIRVTGLVTELGGRRIHDGLDLAVRRGEVMGIVGGSGTGKSVLLRTLVGLIRPAAGRVEVLGVDLATADQAARATVDRRVGVLFQDGALFSSLTVLENVMVPLVEHTSLPVDLAREIALVKIGLVGLAAGADRLRPAELSGGMRKRAGLARALALDPEILFLDEPTAGLDPIGAAAFDDLVADLQRALGHTVVMVTHDLDTLAAVCQRIAVLVDGRVKVGTLADLMVDEHPWIHDYFHGPRARAVPGGMDRSQRAVQR